MTKTQETAIALIKEYEAVVKKQESEIYDYTEKMKPFQDKFKSDTDTIQNQSLLRLEPLEKRRKEIEQKLLKLGSKELKKLEANKPTLFVEDNWKFEDSAYYLHVSRETVADTGNDFELWKFIKRFSDYADVKFKIKELKKVFVDTKLAKPFLKIGFKLKTNTAVELKRSAKS